MRKLLRQDALRHSSGELGSAVGFYYLCLAMKTYKAQGIVLHTIKYGDTSMVAYLLTDLHGRRNFMVQGVKSTKGKGSKASMLQPMFTLEFEGLTSSHSQMDRMKDVRMGYPLRSLPFDVRKSTIALFMAEVLYKLIKEVEPNSPLFDFVWNSVVALDGMEDGVANFHLWFLVQMSSFLGFYPANEYSEGDFFDIVEGSFTPLVPSHNIVINKANAQLMDVLMNCPPGELGNLKLGRGQRGDFLASVLHYFGYHLDAINKIQSLKILAEVF